LVKKALFGMSIVAVAMAGCKGGGGSVESAVGTNELAVVNGQSIPITYYYSLMEHADLVTAIVDPNSLVPDSTGKFPPQVTRVQITPALNLQVLRDAINSELIRQLAKADNLYPSGEAIDKEIAYQQSRDVDYVKKLNNQGFSVEQIKDRIGLELARFNLLTKGMSATPEDIDKFIADNPTKFINPASASLLMIEVGDKNTKALADKELSQQQLFSAVAQHYSIQQNGKSLGYHFPQTNLDRFPPALRALVDKTKEFSTTDWQYDAPTKHYVKFYIERKVPAKKITIDDKIKEAVRREVLATKGQQANDVNKRINDFLKTSKIEIKVNALQEPWKQAFEQLVKNGDQAEKPGSQAADTKTP
jgi:hypothetical protein